MANKSLFDGLLGHLGFAKKPVRRKKAKDRKTASGEAESQAAELGAFEARLKAVLSSQGQDMTNHVHRIGLDKIRDALGERWDKSRDAIHEAARKSIEAHLTPQELFIRRDDLSYLVVMPTITSEEGRLKCTMIGEEVARRLIGAEAAADLVDVRTAKTVEEGSVTFDEGKEETAVEESPPKPSDSLAHVRFIYRPLLAVKTKVISTFLCIPVTGGEGEPFRSNYDVLSDQPRADEIFALDILTLEQAGQELKALVQGGGRSLLAIPVHFETLANTERRAAFIHRYGVLFEGLEKRVILELMELPDGIPQPRLLQLVGALRPYSRAVLARFAPGHRNFTAYRTAGLHAVGMDIYQTDETEAALMKRMEAFVVGARSNQLKSYVGGIHSISLFTIAMTSGFDYLSGHALSSTVTRAKDIQTFQLAAPYRALLGKGRTGGGR